MLIPRRAVADRRRRAALNRDGVNIAEQIERDHFAVRRDVHRRPCGLADIERYFPGFSARRVDVGRRILWLGRRWRSALFLSGREREGEGRGRDSWYSSFTRGILRRPTIDPSLARRNCWSWY